MSALEQCRSAALGGHVERCQDCGHSRIAYNSCRNRHCPKCQGAAAKDWLAARETDLLPVGYFHVVFTLPAEIAPIAYQNKAVVYDPLFRTAAACAIAAGNSRDERRPAAAKHQGLGRAPQGCGRHRRAQQSHYLRGSAAALSADRGGISIMGPRLRPARPARLAQHSTSPISHAPAAARPARAALSRPSSRRVTAIAPATVLSNAMLRSKLATRLERRGRWTCWSPRPSSVQAVPRACSVADDVAYSLPSRSWIRSARRWRCTAMPI